VLPVRVMRLLGVKLLIVTNAAGGLNPDFNVGDIMVIQDHFGLPCLAGNTPLRGINNDSLGPRFPAMSDAYDSELQAIVLNAADRLKLADKVRPNGTYCFVAGPCYETKVECRFLRSIGGDSVGMSTVPEVIAAKHCGMKILGLSLITNKVVTTNDKNAVHASHAEVLAAVGASGLHVEAIVKNIITKSIIGEYLNALPAVNYVRKAVTKTCCGGTKTTTKCGCPAGTCKCGPSCSCTPGNCKCGTAANSCCALSTAVFCCGTTGNCGTNCCTAAHHVAAVLGAAALVTGLFLAIKYKTHCNR